jgi:hypothetical protein
MPKLVVLITTDTANSLRIAETWQEAGASGVSIIDTHGVRGLQRQKGQRAPELSLATSMASILNQLRETNVMLFSVVESDLVDTLITIAQDIVGDLTNPETGILFVIDVEKILSTDQAKLPPDKAG